MTGWKNGKNKEGEERTRERGRRGVEELSTGGDSGGGGGTNKN
jgi:hypothetical protein